VFHFFFPQEGEADMFEESELQSLVVRAQQGDREAFGALAREFEPAIFGIVFRRLRNSAEAGEVTQDVFLRAMRKLSQLRDPDRFVGWLKRIAVRLAINRAVRRPREFVQPPETLTIFAQRMSPVDRVLQSERADQVRTGLTQLRPLDRDTLLAFYFEGQSLKEMSDRFASPVGTIKRRLHTARHRLKEALTERQPA
jgi:RNA polymerase sigma-70 factor (ECF subfamily)